jgi:hypothetical protein
LALRAARRDGPYGVGAQFFQNEELLYSRRFDGTSFAVTPQAPKVVISSGRDLEVVSVEPPVRLTTGHEWEPPSEGAGSGELNVTNGTRKDGVAVLYDQIDGGRVRARRAVYVVAGEDTRLHRIAPGYTLRFVLGVDWNDNGASFNAALKATHSTTFWISLRAKLTTGSSIPNNQ